MLDSTRSIQPGRGFGVAKSRLRQIATLGALLVALSPSVSVADDRGAASGKGSADLQGLQQAFQRVAERVAPSVVAIRSKRSYAAASGGVERAASAGGTEQMVIVNGAGTVIRNDGSILTNEHVIQAANEIEVYCHDGRKFPASVVASDARSDLAVLRIDRHDLPPAALCDWSKVARGQWTIAVGNPFGLGSDGKLSVSVGVISNLSRRLPGLGEADDRLYQDMIQTTAPISPGNSGGPLFNVDGELVGIVTAMHTRTAGDEGIGFALPLNEATRRRSDQLASGSAVEHGYIGLSVREPRPSERESSGIGGRSGAVVDGVEPDGPAASAGIRDGDFVVRIGDLAVEDTTQMAGIVGAWPAGSSLPISIKRSGRSIDATITVARRQASRVAWMRGAVAWRGLRVANLTAESRSRLNIDASALGVVVIEVTKDSPADRCGLRMGDVVERVGGGLVLDVNGFRSRTQAESGSVELRLRTGAVRSVAP